MQRAARVFERTAIDDELRMRSLQTRSEFLLQLRCRRSIDAAAHGDDTDVAILRDARNQTLRVAQCQKTISTILKLLLFFYMWLALKLKDKSSKIVL